MLHNQRIRHQFRHPPIHKIPQIIDHAGFENTDINKCECECEA